VAGGAQVAALGPAHRGQERHAVLGKVGVLLAGGELDIGAGPLGCPDVFVVESVECGAAGPVAPGQLEGVLDTHPALLWTVDEEDAPE